LIVVYHLVRSAILLPAGFLCNSGQGGSCSAGQGFCGGGRRLPFFARKSPLFFFPAEHEFQGERRRERSARVRRLMSTRGRDTPPPPRRAFVDDPRGSSAVYRHRSTRPSFAPAPGRTNLQSFSVQERDRATSSSPRECVLPKASSSFKKFPVTKFS